MSTDFAATSKERRSQWKPTPWSAARRTKVGEPSKELPEERATRIVEDLYARVVKEISQAEEAALTEGRREAFEEAAALLPSSDRIKEYELNCELGELTWYEEAWKDYASAIRALAEGVEGGEKGDS